MSLILLEMREAAKAATKVEMKHALRTAADMLQSAITAFNKEPCEEALRWLNGQWAHAVRVLNQFNEPPAPAPVSSGLKQGALLQVAA